MNDDQAPNKYEPTDVVLDTSHSRVVENQTVEKVMEDSFFRYSMSVIIDRALPDVRDGLKPVHRRILYTMGENGLRHNAKYRKSATTVGDVMGKYHPHGDSAIYDSLVRLAQPWSMRYPLIDGQGNFGSMDGDPPAAMRYTEARMTKPSEEMLVDIEKNTVDFRPNYDGSQQEPIVLPAKLPNLLLNGQIGIAVGMATNIPPHNAGELIDACVELIDNKEATVDDLLKHVKGPDFPTGATVYGGAPMLQAYQTGRGSVTIRAVAEIEETKRGRHQIVVTEMPYAVNKSTLIEKIADLVKDKRITAISDLRDESARGTVRVVIELKKDAYPKKVLNQLYKLTALQTSFHFNMLALIDGIQPRVLGLQEILQEFIKHRQKVVRRRTEFELTKAKERAHILEGYKIALDHIDEVIKTIRASKTQDEAEKNLISKFKLTEIQAKAILAMQLRRLTGLERQSIENELKELQKLIKKLEAILADENEILRVIKIELLEMKEKFGDERRSKIINHELGKFSDEELIPEEESVILLTTENYIKRTLLSDYRKQNRGGKGKRGMTTKEEDVIGQLVPANTHDWLFFFTNRGRVFRLKAYEVPAAGLAAKGVAAVNLLQLQPEEKITSIIKHEKDAQEDGYLFMATRKGTVKKTPLTEFAFQLQKGKIAIGLDEGDALVDVALTDGASDVLLFASNGKSVRFDEAEVRAMGRNATGVRGMRLTDGASVVSMIVAQGEGDILTATERGYGKRTPLAEYPKKGRGTQGVIAIQCSDRNGALVAAVQLDDGHELMLVSNLGTLVRTRAAEVARVGRNTQGVTLIRLPDEEALTGVVRLDAGSESEGEGEGEDSAPTDPAAPLS